MHSSLNKETGRVVVGRAWEGVAVTHTDLSSRQVMGSDKPSRALTAGGVCERLLRTVTWQTTSC